MNGSGSGSVSGGSYRGKGPPVVRDNGREFCGLVGQVGGIAAEGEGKPDNCGRQAEGGEFDSAAIENVHALFIPQDCSGSKGRVTF